MDWENIAPMIVAVVFTLTVGGVVILRPIAKRISELLELYARDKHAGVEGDVHHIRDLLETMNARLQLMEDRQDFTERLIGSGEARQAQPRDHDGAA
ncbi:MAG: hypothetical protein O2958_09220 [Gemmatimonadetes bacterium]|nr:hypothetical protein [Gemmatimonadota bacterium]